MAACRLTTVSVEDVADDVENELEQSGEESSDTPVALFLLHV